MIFMSHLNNAIYTGIRLDFIIDYRVKLKRYLSNESDNMVLERL